MKKKILPVKLIVFALIIIFNTEMLYANGGEHLKNIEGENLYNKVLTQNLSDFSDKKHLEKNTRDISHDNYSGLSNWEVMQKNKQNQVNLGKWGMPTWEKVVIIGTPILASFLSIAGIWYCCCRNPPNKDINIEISETISKTEAREIKAAIINLININLKRSRYYTEDELYSYTFTYNTPTSKYYTIDITKPANQAWKVIVIQTSKPKPYLSSESDISYRFYSFFKNSGIDDKADNIFSLNSIGILFGKSKSLYFIKNSDIEQCEEALTEPVSSMFSRIDLMSLGMIKPTVADIQETNTGFYVTVTDGIAGKSNGKTARALLWYNAEEGYYTVCYKDYVSKASRLQIYTLKDNRCALASDQLNTIEIIDPLNQSNTSSLCEFEDNVISVINTSLTDFFNGKDSLLVGNKKNGYVELYHRGDSSREWDTDYEMAAILAQIPGLSCIASGKDSYNHDVILCGDLNGGVTELVKGKSYQGFDRYTLPDLPQPPMSRSNAIEASILNIGIMNGNIVVQASINGSQNLVDAYQIPVDWYKSSSNAQWAEIPEMPEPKDTVVIN